MADYIVKHRKLYLRVDGKLQHVPQGSTISLSDKQAEKMGARVAPASSKQVKVGGSDDVGALKARAAELGITVDSRWKAQRLSEEIAKVEAELAKVGN